MWHSTESNTCKYSYNKYSHFYIKAGLVGNRLSSCYISSSCSRCLPPHRSPCQAKLQDRKFLEDASLHLNITWMILAGMHQCFVYSLCMCVREGVCVQYCMYVSFIHGIRSLQACTFDLYYNYRM